jgi:hypothetical protein
MCRLLLSPKIKQGFDFRHEGVSRPRKFFQEREDLPQGVYPLAFMTIKANGTNRQSLVGRVGVEPTAR